MDITLEQVEELRRRAGLSYEEARDSLAAANGSLLDALIALEKAGRLPGGQGGTYSTRGGPRQEAPVGAPIPSAAAAGGEEDKTNSAFRRFFTRLADILRPSSQNQFEIWRRGEMHTAMPILILIILLAAFFWISMPLLIVGLFFGFRYHFSGPDLGRRDLNSAMDKVSDTVDSMKADLKREYRDKHDKQ